MAKSSRSKWKKLHRRQKAKEEAANTVKRIKQLHKKLELTVKGGISAVPPQEPEKRFHFLNPELDPHVPNTRKDLNNNYRAELNHVHYDYTKPLKLTPPKSNFYGKTNTNAPHPMTQNFETLDADAPVAGRALTKADVERMAQKQLEQEASRTVAANEAEEDTRHGNSVDNSYDDDDAASSSNNNSDGPEEFVFGLTDAAPRRVSKSTSKASKAAASLSKKERKSNATKTRSTHAVVAALAAAAAAEEDEEQVPHHGSSGGSSSSDAKVGKKIASMQAMHKKGGIMISAGGASKMKKVGTRGGASGTRVVSSGGKAAQKKTGNKKVATK